MSEDSGWTELEYDISGSDGSDLIEVSDYGVLAAAHPMDTAPVIETAVE